MAGQAPISLRSRGAEPLGGGVRKPALTPASYPLHRSFRPRWTHARSSSTVCSCLWRRAAFTLYVCGAFRKWGFSMILPSVRERPVAILLGLIPCIPHSLPRPSLAPPLFRFRPARSYRHLPRVPQSVQQGEPYRCEPPLLYSPNNTCFLSVSLLVCVPSPSYPPCPRSALTPPSSFFCVPFSQTPNAGPHDLLSGEDGPGRCSRSEG